ncbi:hypothetical protein SAMN02910357_01718 [Succinivibrio dextrinosolvens]|uniref:hypothetical protein n=1 Tax=Succinivibrio dextrinosolvens TaxID=83771 RepID=UPI0008E923A0|nr:hypothetical protein [Succinivibrio dextrinosolvens]SFS76741.1 hypothetical protein SAMN02910357_01718 [Succinivibrio dextrinosolvens]
MDKNCQSTLFGDAEKLLLGALLGAAVLGVASFFIANQSDEIQVPEDVFDDESLNGEDN